MSNYIKHHGVKGQKWGVRRYQNKDGSLTPAGAKRYKDEINAQSRTIKKGTEVQTISKTAINLNDTKSRRSKRLYVSYTDYDKDEYVNMMGNFMYGGDKAYKNTFVVKKDMKVASDKDVVDAFISLAKKDPAKTAKDIANAYNENSIFLRKSEKTLNKKISQLSSDPNDAKVIKMAEQYVKNAIVGTKSTTTDNFYAYLTKKGFDAISDTNDRKSGAQDPLIILNMNVIKQTGSVKLTSKDLEAYYNYTISDEHMNKANDLSKVQHQEMLGDTLQHHGVKGQKWGVRRYQNKDGSLTPKGKQRYGDADNFKKQYPEDVKKGIKKAGSVIDKAKDVNDKMVKKANEQKIKDDISKMSDQELQKIVNRLNMEERYKQVMNSRAAEDGKDTVGKILEYAGATLAVGASAITLYTQIRELKKN